KRMISDIACALDDFGQDTIPFLLSLVRGRRQNPEACRAALWVLKCFARRQPRVLRDSVPVLRDLLGERDRERRLTALEIFWDMGKEAKAALPDILALVPVASDYEKAFAAGAVYGLTGSVERPLQILLGLWRSRDAAARHRVAVIVGEMG